MYNILFQNVKMTMGNDAKKCLDYLARLQEVAEDILIDKERIVDHSRRSNELREAKRYKCILIILM